MKKTLITILATVLVCCCAVGGTLAWLMDKTETITNTFTVGNVDIELTETKGTTTDNKAFSYKMVPGSTIEKDPKITVKAGSEACYVFVKIEESDNLGTYITWAIADDWTQLSGVAGVYYLEQAALTVGSAVDVEYSVLANDEVTVKNTVTKKEMDDLNVSGATQPTLKFTAYAVQAENMTDANDAWTEGGFN